MKDEDSDWWSGLQTVSSFDNGNTSHVSQDVEEPVELCRPSSLLAESLIGELCKLIENDQKQQKQLYLIICKKLHQMKLIDESYRMEEFESLRSYYQKALYQLVTVAKNLNKSPDKKAMLPKANQQVCIKNDLKAWSRYLTEYDELGLIARGGFGQVYKAQNKLDGEVYAVKKIFLRYSAATFLTSVQEVKFIAKLNHPNIVTYKAAWLEHIDSSHRSQHIIDDIGNFIIESSSDKQDSSGGVVFESSDIHSDNGDVNDNYAIVKKQPNNTLAAWSPSNVSSYCKQWACLYIQMQLCDLTLRQWLDKRNHMFEPVKERDCLMLFKKIIQGVAYIHSQGVVHHDIKPSNIFISNDLHQVQVGDFGLACSLLTHNPDVSVVPSSHAHHGQVGTKLYAAPEQLNGDCTYKSDIYSVGILLMELIQPFQTDMERSKVIGRVKSGKIPLELSNSFPTAVKAITRCIYHSPHKRPTAQELLELIDDEDRSNNERIIAEKDETIRRLHKEASAREKEIADLKKQLSELSSSP